uniref:Homing endonuclease LAGLIDADG domain-containing protein n=1 Tax=Hypsizygus marmoreus TaxID=39966 RepID=A0A4P8D2T3_HYPMA|nr:hypothetical protein [Hypsizygus marmoreus]
MGKRYIGGIKLPNSGDTLKLLVPNCSWKTISGWTNLSGMVTSQKISENEMGYRGSKSDFNSKVKSVKEQRVDGSWCINRFLHLRYTLMGFERNYQVKILSKQLKVKNFSTLTTSSPSNPLFWTGLIDAEGSFSIIIDRNKIRKLGWRVQSKFQIGLHKRDYNLLILLQKYLKGIGTIHIDSNRNRVNYSVDSNKDLTILINHFDKYPLLTQKGADFILFKEVVKLFKNKHHLTLPQGVGLKQIINIKASMNLGLSDMLKSEFYDFIPTPYGIDRPTINTQIIPEANWISGFVSGEGTFYALITQSTNKIGSRVQLRFRIVQHERDIKLMENIIKYLGAGKIYKYPNTPAVCLSIVKFSDLSNIIIPLFNQNPIFGVKLEDYLSRTGLV